MIIGRGVFVGLTESELLDIASAELAAKERKRMFQGSKNAKTDRL
jgi:hypothetical protein